MIGKGLPIGNGPYLSKRLGVAGINEMDFSGVAGKPRGMGRDEGATKTRWSRGILCDRCAEGLGASLDVCVSGVGNGVSVSVTGIM